ncbi:MAG: glycosyltransferase family 4 protein [Deltaproteobacteria bacterium]|nr:glycosyltransferase family 4 protein [Deltaproteobacteria bacterium]
MISDRAFGVKFKAKRKRPLLKVILDARKIFDGGIGRYTQNLAEGLAARSDVSLTLIVPPGFSGSKSEEWQWLSAVNLIEDPARPYSLDELFGMPRRLNFSKFDVYHVPHYTLPYGVSIPAVITVHDLTHITHPQRWYYPAVATFLVRSGVSRARRVLTVSQASREGLAMLLRKHPRELAKVRVVPNAIHPFFLSACEPQPFLRDRFQIEAPYLLAVCSMNKPHKGVPDLISAFTAVKERLFADKQFSKLRLVLVGKGVEELAKRRADQTQGDIVAVGTVTGNELLNLYAGAEALVVPSLAEGFFVPVLEARAQGLNVISRPIPAVKELLCEQDLVARDFSVEALEEAILCFFKRGRIPFQVKEVLRPYLQERVVEQACKVYLEACMAEE